LGRRNAQPAICHDISVLRCTDPPARDAEEEAPATERQLDVPDDPASGLSAQDPTDRQAFEQRAMERYGMAAVGTLSAGVAHQVDNPLTYLLLNLEQVLRRVRAARASDDPVALIGSDAAGLASFEQSLKDAVDGANRIKQVVRDLLTVAQGDAEHGTTMDLRCVVESATQLTWHQISQRARLRKTLGQVPPVAANEARLGRVFLNLMVNAAQAIPVGHSEGHEVHIATSTDEPGNAVVEVSDTGSGIAPEHIGRIFDPFFTTKGEDGSGLGLSVSCGIVRNLGGDITVRSVLGRGTTFRVVIPPVWRRHEAASTGSRHGHAGHLL
jgi:signal transduction histidine kinase